MFCRCNTCFPGKWILETDFNDNSEDFVFNPVTSFRETEKLLKLYPQFKSLWHNAL